jgi:hypothetical protein
LDAQGGPGGSTLETYVRALLAAKAADQYKRDLVWWDQRGTLHAEPNLLCPEVTDVQIRDAVEHLATDAAKQLQVAAYQACAERLMQSGIVLPPFNSVENAHDIDAIRRAHACLLPAHEQLEGTARS